MVCSKCKKRLATIRISQLVNNKTAEVFLCQDCAKENALAGMQAMIGGISNMIPGLFTHGGDYNKYIVQKAEPATCSLCGKSFEEIQNDGKLGCAMCYSDFREKLRPIVERIYGSARHKGKCPSNIPVELKNAIEIDELKAMLSTAIELEEYEKAAEIRDSIKKLEYTTGDSPNTQSQDAH